MKTSVTASPHSCGFLHNMAKTIHGPASGAGDCETATSLPVPQLRVHRCQREGPRRVGAIARGSAVGACCVVAVMQKSRSDPGAVAWHPMGPLPSLPAACGEAAAGWAQPLPQDGSAQRRLLCWSIPSCYPGAAR